MENGDIVTDNSVLPQENRWQLNIIEDNKSDNLAETDKLEANNLLEKECDKDVEEKESENVSVPFFGGNLSLAQVKEMQIQARKRPKFPARNIDSCSMKNDRTTNQLNKSEPSNTASVLDFSEDSSVYSVRSFGGERNKTYSERKPKENLDKTCHSAGELRMRSFDENKRFKRKTTLDGFGRSRVENRGVVDFGRCEYESKKIVDAIENKDRRLNVIKKSYLEQYKKRREKEVTGYMGAKSVSSSQFSLNLSCSTLKTDFEERVSEVGSSCLCCSSSDERLQKELLTDSDVKTHSSSFVSCESSVRSGEDGKEELMIHEKVEEKEVEVEEECGAKKNGVDGKSTKNQKKKTTKLEKEIRRPSKSPLIPMRLARSLGPDLEAIKPKLTALQKRKEYGNRMSCLNRENTQLKHISENNKIMQNTPNEEEEEGVEIPIVHYSTDQLDTSKLLSKPSPQIQKRKRRINTTKKPQKTADLADATDASEVSLMIRRHEEEKRLAENIKHQLLLK